MAGMILSIITFLPAVAALILLVFLRDDDEAGPTMPVGLRLLRRSLPLWPAF